MAEPIEPLRKILRLDKIKYFETHLAIINCLISNKMTQTEMEVLAVFLSFEGELIERLRFSTPYRKIVREILGLSHAALGNHLKGLRDKSLIVEQPNDIYLVKSYLIPRRDIQEYTIRLINNG